MVRLLSATMAYLCLGLAFIGVFVPGLPTVPFLLLTAWFAARGCPRLHRWLYAHPQFGKLLIDWEQQRAIARGTKILGIVMLAASWCVMYLRVQNLTLLVAITASMLLMMSFLATRPEPR